jgi:hypothetical protein
MLMGKPQTLIIVGLVRILKSDYMLPSCARIQVAGFLTFEAS